MGARLTSTLAFMVIAGCCEPGTEAVLPPGTCGEDCESYRICNEDGRWGSCKCRGSLPPCFDGETRPCEYYELPEGCCEGVVECNASDLYHAFWGSCECTVWCDADEGPDAPGDPPPDPEDADDITLDPGSDGEDVEDGG